MYGYWNSWYAGWGWFLWFGVIFLLFSSLGNWGYTYRAHRRFNDVAPTPTKDAFDILSERYAKGEITRDEFHRMKSEISDISHVVPLNTPKSSSTNSSKKSA